MNCVAPFLWSFSKSHNNQPCIVVGVLVVCHTQHWRIQQDALGGITFVVPHVVSVWHGERLHVGLSFNTNVSMMFLILLFSVYKSKIKLKLKCFMHILCVCICVFG
jgi:hypothetical protein